jgi:hypothetical protein
VNPHYPAIAERAGHRCEYCRAPEPLFNFPFEVEHVIPPLHGGTDSDDNLALACRACNAHKATAVLHADPLTGVAARLFHPRRDHWSEHFRLDGDTGVIEGLTAVGRASVARLSMNAAPQIRARRLWTRLGVSP